MKCGVAITCLAMTIHSCGPPAYKGGFDSANPAAKMYAIEDAARQGDRAALRQIIEQLDSDDPAVRSLAITALKRLTGETRGYCDADPLVLRREAVAEWIRAEKAGELNIQIEPTTDMNTPAANEPEATTDHG